MRVVLDTNVLVAGLRSNRGASFQVLSSLPAHAFTPLLSVALFLEYEAVLKRPEHLAASDLAETDIDIVLDMVAAVSEKIELHYLWRPQLRDAADEMVLELAIAGTADAIVTFNVGDFAEAAPHFGLEVMVPRTFWKRLEEI
jgi:putative PIN family toxin of toxin-antitoxin system